MAEVGVASLVMVLVVAVKVVHQQAVAVHLVVDNLGSSLDTLDILGNSLDLVATMDNLGNSLDTMVAVLVAGHLGNSLGTLVVEVLVPGGVAEEVAPPRDKSSATGVARRVTSPPSVKRLW